jgi:hypothetical protein
MLHDDSSAWLARPQQVNFEATRTSNRNPLRRKEKKFSILAPKTPIYNFQYEDFCYSLLVL